MEQTDQLTETVLRLISLQIFYLNYYVLAGIIYILILEHKTVIEIIRDRKKIFGSKKKILLKKYLPIFLKRLCYLLGGILLFLSGFYIVYFIQKSFWEQLSPTFVDSIPDDYVRYTEKGNLFAIRSGVIAVATIQLAGIALILSAGGKWLVNTAKAITLLTIVCLLVVVVAVIGKLI